MGLLRPVVNDWAPPSARPICTAQGHVLRHQGKNPVLLEERTSVRRSRKSDKQRAKYVHLNPKRRSTLILSE